MAMIWFAILYNGSLKLDHIAGNKNRKVDKRQIGRKKNEAFVLMINRKDAMNAKKFSIPVVLTRLASLLLSPNP